MGALTKNIKREELAKQVINRRMLYAAGLGLIPIPLLDTVSIMGSQILMIKEMASIYKIPFDTQKVKAFVGSLVGSLGAIGGVKAIPGIGSIMGGATVAISGAAATYAIGKVFIHHFDQGGTLLDFDAEKSRQYFLQLYEEGAIKTEELKEKEFKKSGAASIDIESRNGFNQDKNNKESLLKESKEKKIFKYRQKNRIIFLGLIFAIFGLLVLNYLFWDTPNSANEHLKEIIQDTRVISLMPDENIDIDDLNRLTAFDPNDTEGVIYNHIRQRNAVYPKRFVLSAARFRNSSDVISSGAKTQMKNLALLMKVYPDLEMHFYGQTTNKGPVFNRQRVGRDRARLLKSTLEEYGISTFRTSANYIEKLDGVYFDYWGAEVVIDVSTKESEVYLKPESIISN